MEMELDMAPTPSQSIHIEPDPNSDDSLWITSELRDPDTDSLQSLTSSVLAYEYRNGRRYAVYGSGRYVLPNDESECDRIDLLQHIFGMLFGGRLVFAPIPSPQRILDVGTGTGTWAIDVATMYPRAQVTGTDMSAHQPSWVPPNLSFIIDDAELEWSYSSQFDLIHMQGLNGAIRDWPRLFKQAYDHLAPGGYLEVKDTDFKATCDDNTIPTTSSLRTWENECVRACTLLDQTLTAPAHVRRWMEAAGFLDVEERLFRLPVNSWPKDPELKEIGRFQNFQYMQALSPYALGLLVEVLGWAREETEVLLAGVRENLRDRRLHGYHIVRVVTGRHP
ncbi:S-adenosyl-L-methionine-dependent methyltransferase [Aspergillus sclerotioniger CBS 115572]|uniref:S-adenosyl-L-methionine-dependent methyltransferase n=1 Tax=Aspergillus sclerotioniger CBS 115572 TaxID=1450535 RepID=A0A317WUW7_9EURO|nr:S-adenosyl-L-methionine-dependent methyltransferase [Aspergillus sclerotioniger CBS 115572]PWY88638.1 S-adenosyl-L-methionine-dependent methyltransferase [Aspergillus sclerotioniger CBS 115572]